MARTFGFFWLVCALIGAIVSVALPPLAGRTSEIELWEDCIFFFVFFVVVNLVQWVLAGWLYVWSYRALCRSQAHLALKSLYPTLLSNAPLLVWGVTASAAVAETLSRKAAPYLLWGYVLIAMVCIAVVCALVCTVYAWSRRQPHLHLAALACAGCALSVTGLVSILVIVVVGLGDRLGESLFCVFFPVFLSFPGFWMAVAFLRCLKTESAGRSTS